MESILLTLHIIVALSLVIAVLLQRSEGGLGGLGGGTEITKAQLKSRALDIHTRYPFQTLVFGTPPDPPNPPTQTEKTNAEVETMVDDWCTEKNAS